MNCPSCNIAFEKGFVYVRGFGGSLFWSTSGTTRFFSRKKLEQINLDELSTVRIGGQAVVPAWRCPSCHLIAFSST